MAFIDKKDLKTLYSDSKTEAHIWRQDYPQFQRLADNDLMEGLDPNLPEVNDGSLAAALFKLPKRIVPKTLSGTVKSLDRDEAWLPELANIYWRKKIIPNANSQAPFMRKWKDAVRKAAMYGSVPIITIFVDKDGQRHSDFLVGQAQDVTLEPGKVSDYDSDIMFWDIYYSKLQLENMIEQAKEEAEKGTNDGYNKWDIPALEAILNSKETTERDSQDSPTQPGATKPKGFKFCIAVQRGVEAPFYMYHSATNKTVREWSNPDPSGDLNIHFLYCYQDLINPYGTGIVKLAGGTQNVLDYMRQADVLATQLGLRPPIMVGGDADSADLDTLVYTQDGMWFTGEAKVERLELTTGIYQELPGRIQMYKTSLNQLIPTGDTSATAAQSGDPTQSKTPAGVKLAAANLSIDDEDFKENLYATYEAVAKSMINTEFANMEGSDIMKLSDDERDILMKAGFPFPENEEGEMSNELEIVWDDVRANFDFEVDAEIDKAQDDADKLEGLMKVAELSASDPNFDAYLQMDKKKLNRGELFSDIVALTTDNDKIITDISPEDEMANAEAMGVDPATGQPVDPQATAGQPDGSLQGMELAPQEEQGEPSMPESAEPSEEEIQANVQGVMEQYGVDENTALAALAAERQGFPPEDVMAHLQKLTQEAQQ